MKMISVIVPCFNEQEVLPLFYGRISQTADKMREYAFEFIFVDDGSSDATLSIIKALSDKDDRVRYCALSRNFGKESAMYAGLEKSRGDFVCVIDADLQDPPELIIQMTAILESGEYDCAATRRTDRKGEPKLRSFCANVFYRFINCISKTQIMNGARDFRMMTRKMTDAILRVCEYNRFSKGIFGWVGFNTKWIEFENTERAAGKTKWSFFKLFKYSIEGIIAFSTAPLAAASFIGLLFCIIAFVMICVIVIKTLIWGDPVGGWPSLACIVFLVGGVQLLCTGIIGQYLSKTYLETKRRPIYIEKESGGKSELTNKD